MTRRILVGLLTWFLLALPVAAETPPEVVEQLSGSRDAREAAARLPGTRSGIWQALWQ